ncbi:ankryin [Mycobacterium sp. M1]|uniref:Ankryin n=1 Tax=Mycolicibacter acidiphilus TaxID=2835306 RepID=A0ABS5RGY1_9MYCO|nr:ankyrin repeat domain-containing protein [Mycolicibacter acidiphilus]MBS9533557.1 ankryin [Mycolicibacter acidiphilus]
MTTYSELRGTAAVWPGSLDPALLGKRQVQASMYLADMARRGKWRKVLRELDHSDRLVDVKQWRPGGTSWLTVLHQAAWNDAPPDVVGELLKRGALRSQTDAHGRTAHDIAVEHGRSAELLELLAPPPSPIGADEVGPLNANLAAIIDDLIQPKFDDPRFGGKGLRDLLRYPPVELLHEPTGAELWFPVPYLWGGFRVTLEDDHVGLLGGYRELDAKGAMHVATAAFVIDVSSVTQVHTSYS